MSTLQIGGIISILLGFFALALDLFLHDVRRITKRHLFLIKGSKDIPEFHACILFWVIGLGLLVIESLMPVITAALI